MLLVACYKQHGTIHDATLLKATVACYKVASCMVAFIGSRFLRHLQKVITLKVSDYKYLDNDVVECIYQWQ